MHIAIPPPAERRIRREARSETLRALALSLRRGGWTLAAIAKVLGVSTTRAFQMVRKAERLIRERSESEEGAPARERPSDSNDEEDPLAPGPEEQAPWLYPPRTT